MPRTEQLIALAAFATANGRTWKSALRHCWETGDYNGFEASNFLQQLRNEFGPTWLVNHKLDPTPTWAPKWGFDFFYGSPSNPMDIRSGCVGADTRDEAYQMVRKACPVEASDPRASLKVCSTKQRWPRVVS